MSYITISSAASSLSSHSALDVIYAHREKAAGAVSLSPLLIVIIVLQALLKGGQRDRKTEAG